MEYTSNEDFFGRMTPSTDPEIQLPSFQDLVESVRPSSRTHEESAGNPHSPLPALLARLGIAKPICSAQRSLNIILADVFHPIGEKRIEALRALQSSDQSTNEQVIRALCSSVKDELQDVRAVAVEILGTLGQTLPESMVPIYLRSLLGALVDAKWDVRASAARALGNVGSLVPTNTLIKALHWEQDESVRAALVQALSKQRTSMSTQTIVSILREDTSWLVRVAAARALGTLEGEIATQALIYVLRNDLDASVRAVAASALGIAGKKEAETALFEALLDDQEVLEAATIALQQLDEETRNLKQRRAWEVSGSTYQVPEEKQSYHSAKKERKQSLEVPAVGMASQDELAFFTFAEFIKDKKGYVHDLRLLDSDQGCVLLISCAYQHNDDSLQEGLFPFIRHIADIEPIEAVADEPDETIQVVLEQTIKFWEKLRWQELLIVSFALLPSLQEKRKGYHPFRVVLTGASCQHVRKNDSPLLNEIVAAWDDTLQELSVSQDAQDLTNLKIWYQLTSEYAPTSKSA